MLMTEEFETIIGLEIHAQLNTKRKMFCGCNNNADNKEPNFTVCPRCLGMPGTLPVTNKEALIKAVQVGLVFNSKINQKSKFDRKHYFYPDLPKGYQVSQYDQPICIGGSVELLNKNEKRTIRFNRIHLEEDAGKLIHPTGKKYTLVDLNRAGTPLIEMVTEPDIKSPKEAKDFMKLIQAELKNQGVSDADMEKGHLRCDANISIMQKTKTQNLKPIMSEIVEIKNINSFRFVEKALTFEENRLKSEFSNWPQKRTKITRGFNSKTGETYEQRRKEEAADYRYFPEPDLPPVDGSALIMEAEKRIVATMPQKLVELRKKINIDSDTANIILFNPEIEQFLWPLKSQSYISALAKLLAHNPEFIKQDKKELVKYAEAITAGRISTGLAKQKLLTGDKFSEESKTIDPSEIQEFVKKLIKDNPDAVTRYKAGKTNLLGFFIGQAMHKFRGQVEPRILNQIILEEINK